MVSIVGVVLSGKENYQERARKDQCMLIFNDLWDGTYEGQLELDGTSIEPTKPNSEK